MTYSKRSILPGSRKTEHSSGIVHAVDPSPKKIGAALLYKVRVEDLGIYWNVKTPMGKIFLHWALGRTNQGCWLRQGDFIEYDIHSWEEPHPLAIFGGDASYRVFQIHNVKILQEVGNVI